ncbi:MAG: hypothetical protein M0Q51_06395 [Bacteroidales bacterium]|nr:hypothetical protein [Bacteroidales bacterium]
MTLTVTKNLETLCPIDNPKVVIIGTDNQYSTAGVTAKLYLKFSQTEENQGYNIVLKWNDKQITFPLADEPDDSGEQMHTATENQTLNDWLQVLCEDLNSNYYLSKDFEVTVYDLTSLRFVAWKEGELYNLELIRNAGTIAGITEDPAAVDGIDPVLRDFYNVFLQVKPLNSEESLGQDMVGPDLSGNCNFDIHDLLCDFLTPEFEWPHEAGDTHHPRINFIKQFRVLYAESYDREYKKLFTLSGDHYAVLGGFDYKILAALNGIAYSLSDFIIAFKAFLTWQPLVKRITTTQRDKLFYLVFNDISQLRPYIKIYYTDGTSANNHQVTSFATAQYQVHEFYTDYVSLGIAAKLPNGKACLKYDYWLQDEANNIISQVRTYEIEFRQQPFSRTFIFRNSFGAYDVFRTTGRKKHINKYERMILERNLSEYTVAQQYQILESESFQVSSGYISKTIKNWLRELMLSEEVFEILGDYKFPILIQNEEVDNIDDLETIYEIDILYKYAFKNPKYSELSNTMPLLAENLNILLNEDGESLFA